ncbi:M48 family metallopeptidase [Prosthecomicrobium sp. N25]|uniref:M48 family metallopeptidase n=1 Tax=Prosthecomicrobium sp. N25 TaxID=3129254 RepID=UPI003077B3A1
MPMSFFARRPVLPAHVDLDLGDGRTARVAVRQEPRARRYSLRIPTAGDAPVLTLPRTGRLPEALAFLERHRGWLADRLARRPAAIAFEHGALLPLRGTPHRVFHRPDLRGTAWVETLGELPHIMVTGAREHLPRRLTDFLKREARRDIEPAVALHAGRLAVRPTAIRLKDTRSRWGSCTATGELSFSWRVILAPPFVLDYLVAHEVAHLRELNHSHRFWRAVRETCPDMDRGRVWLKRHGTLLHAYGA